MIRGRYGRFYWLLIAVALLLSACAGPTPQPEVKEETALIGDEDIARAVPNIAETVTEVIAMEAGSLPDGPEVDLPEPQLETQGLSVLPGARGFIAYIGRDSNSRNAEPWQLWLANQTSGGITHVYQGAREIQSVAASADGNTIVFTMRRSATSSDLEVYRLVRPGTTPERLTSTSAPERNVAISADGSVIVWEGEHAGRRAVFIREGSSASVLSHSDLQTQPSMSGNGRFIALVRSRSSGDDRVLRYDRTANSYLTIAISSNRLRHPSPSNDGNKVAYFERLDESERIRLRDVSTTTTTTVLSVNATSVLDHPHLTADGSFITFSLLEGGNRQIFTRDLTTNRQALAANATGSVNLYGPYWQEAQPVRPNFIVILTDDQDVDSIAYMPKLQALVVDEGITFSNAFVTTANCCPSRASILRGQYAHNHQVFTNDNANSGGWQKFHELGHESSNLATWLQAAGYRTALVGKYLNGYASSAETRTHVPPGWDDWYGWVNLTYFNYTVNQNGALVKYSRAEEDYQTDVQVRITVDLIQEAVASEEPFFIYVAPFAPHTAGAKPPIPAPRHAGAFPGMVAPRPPSFNEADVSDKPQAIRQLSPLSEGEIADLDLLHRGRLQTLLAVDDMIGSIVDKLAAVGELENTYLIFLSDNGWLQGHHRVRGGKRMPYEEAIRVPLVIRGPGIASGELREHLALNIDLAPTLAELAGADLPDFVDGRSLVPLFDQSPPELGNWRQAFLVEHWGGGNGRAIPNQRAIRTREHKYVSWSRPRVEQELYDLQNDPYELESLHATADPELIGKLGSWLERLGQCAGRSCFELENSP